MTMPQRRPIPQQSRDREGADGYFLTAPQVRHTANIYWSEDSRG
jgi:hypothetical protein